MCLQQHAFTGCHSGYARLVTRLRDRDPGGRGVSPKDGYVQRLPETKKTFRQWISEPGAKPALAIYVVFFGGVWACCMFTGTMLAGYLKVRTSLGTFLLGNILFGILLLGWAILGGSRKLMMTEGGVLDRVIGVFKYREPPLEYDEGPANLARKRGQPNEAIRMYREALRELPHRLDLHYRIAEIEHLDRGRPDTGLRGYKDFLRRLDALERPVTDVEADCAALARVRVEDMERADEAPKPRRVIEIQ